MRNAFLLKPGRRSLRGTGTQGRDVLSRVLCGARLSLSVGLIVQSVSVTVGVLLGLMAGYHGRWIDALVIRPADITLALPTLLLLIAVAAAVRPSPPVALVGIAPGVSFAPGLPIGIAARGFNRVRDGLREAGDPRLCSER